MARYGGVLKKLERVIREIEFSDNLLETLSGIVSRLASDFREDFGIVGARIYIKREDCYEIIAIYGESQAQVGFTIPLTYPPIQSLLKRGTIYMNWKSEGFDPNLEAKLGVNEFAAISIGRNGDNLIAFSLRSDIEPDTDSILHILSTIRQTINIKVAKDSLEDLLYESREIQFSMLPIGDPVLDGFDISGKSTPAEVVGGDAYDFLRINKNILGVLIADSSGHGLPAALQARDVVTGMRMGISEEQKMVKTLEKLNKVIYRSRLSSRFVSLFYGEVESNGNMVYCNAGHNFPYFYNSKEKEFIALEEGGMVLGPTSEASYMRGFIKMSPGDFVILYTDGIVEARNDKGEEFGEERLKELVMKLADKKSSKVVTEILHEVDRYSESNKDLDDRTVVFIKRLKPLTSI